MKLNTFGTVLRYALDLEARGAKFYEEAARQLPEGAERELFASLAKAKTKRRQLVERTRQENVVEMTLAPIIGLDGDAYETPLEVGDLSRAGLLQRAAEYEDKAGQFYLDAGPKLNTDEVEVIFKRLAKENADQKSKVAALLG